MSVDSRQYCLPHERAAAARASDRIDLCDDLAFQHNVHSHVYTIAHTGAVATVDHFHRRREETE